MRGSLALCRTEQPRATPYAHVFLRSRGRQASTRPFLVRWACTAPKEGAVKVTKALGCAATESGTPLPPRRPEATTWKASPRYHAEQLRQREARRLPQEIRSSWLGS